jgi:hypothetical protein
LWLHAILTAYVWLVELIPLGKWNYQKKDHILISLLNEKGMEWGDAALLIFIAVPCGYFGWVTKKRNVRFFIAAFVCDIIWLIMQIISWWVPYIAGARQPWQIKYAQSSTTKILPSFGNHVAPDAMHFVIHILLISAIITGVYDVYKARHVFKKNMV